MTCDRFAQGRPVHSLLGWVLALVAATLSGCSALSWVAPLYGQLSNYADPVCAQSFSTELLAALKGQGETAEDATDAAGRALRIFSRKGEPEQFEAASSSGVSYWFDFEPKTGGCRLRLYARQKGGAITSNTITYYAKRQMTGCICKWNVIVSNGTDD